MNHRASFKRRLVIRACTERPTFFVRTENVRALPNYCSKLGCDDCCAVRCWIETHPAVSSALAKHQSSCFCFGDHRVRKTFLQSSLAINVSWLSVYCYACFGSATFVIEFWKHYSFTISMDKLRIITTTLSIIKLWMLEHLIFNSSCYGIQLRIDSQMSFWLVASP